MSCDYDRPDFVATKIRRAKKTHVCCECGHVIQPGEEYEFVSGKWDGRLDTFTTCTQCADLRDSLADASGGCFLYGGMGEAYLDYLLEVFRGYVEAVSDTYSRVMAKHVQGQS